MAGLGKGNNACSVLNSYHQGCKYDLVEESGPPHMKEFTFSVNVLGHDFTGKGRSKKHAKQAAAALALRRLYGVNLLLGTEEVHEPSGEFLSYMTAPYCSFCSSTYGFQNLLKNKWFLIK